MQRFRNLRFFLSTTVFTSKKFYLSKIVVFTTACLICAPTLSGSIQVTYSLYGSTDGLRFSALQQLIDHYNSIQEQTLVSCRSNPDQYGAYSCQAAYIVGSVPLIDNFGSTNGISHWHNLTRNAYYERRNSAGVVTSSTAAIGGLGATTDIRCPANYLPYKTGQSPYFQLECRKTCAYGETYDVKILECTKPPHRCPQNPTAGNPVELSTGRKTQTFTDYQNSYIQFSRSIYQNETGAKWHFSVNDRAVFEISQPDLDYIRYEKLGYTRFLKKIDATCWRAAGEACAVINILPEGRVSIQEGQIISQYDATGRKNAQVLIGNTASEVKYTYTDSAIHITNGPLTVSALLENGRITVLLLPEGEISYSYNSAGLLTGVDFPDGSSEYYVYSQNGLPLLTEFGRNNQPFAFWSYDNLNRITHSWHQGNFDSTTFNYFPNSVITTNALGKRTQYHFVQLPETRIVQSVQGEPSPNCAAANKEYTYYPNGTLQSKTDWSGNVTSYLRDQFGREISRTEAFGTPAARTILTEYHPTLNLPVRITEPGLITEMTYDTNGRLLNTKKTATAQ